MYRNILFVVNSLVALDSVAALSISVGCPSLMVVLMHANHATYKLAWTVGWCDAKADFLEKSRIQIKSMKIIEGKYLNLRVRLPLRASYFAREQICRVDQSYRVGQEVPLKSSLGSSGRPHYMDPIWTALNPISQSVPGWIHTHTRSEPQHCQGPEPATKHHLEVPAVPQLQSSTFHLYIY